ncbi:MAG TPA: hypothetical protein VN408_41780 [Actinoplanes sp.]|nr:hypothetical protein [Actinoplanes sp.]
MLTPQMRLASMKTAEPPFTTEGGVPHEAIPPVTPPTEMLDNTVTLVAAPPATACTAEASQEQHDNAITQDFPKFSHTAISTELTEALQ